MKRMFVIAMLAVAALLSARGASAQQFHHANLVTVATGPIPVAVKTTCWVNGVLYPVDYSNEIWATMPIGTGMRSG